MNDNLKFHFGPHGAHYGPIGFYDRLLMGFLRTYMFLWYRSGAKTWYPR